LPFVENVPYVALSTDPNAANVTVNDDNGVPEFVTDCTTAPDPSVPDVSIPENSITDHVAAVCVSGTLIVIAPADGEAPSVRHNDNRPCVAPPVS
jgi:hypothetical protein